jgi:hypothetical protein
MGGQVPIVLGEESPNDHRLGSDLPKCPLFQSPLGSFEGVGCWECKCRPQTRAPERGVDVSHSWAFGRPRLGTRPSVGHTELVSAVREGF